MTDTDTSHMFIIIIIITITIIITIIITINTDNDQYESLLRAQSVLTILCDNLFATEEQSVCQSLQTMVTAGSLLSTAPAGDAGAWVMTAVVGVGLITAPLLYHRCQDSPLYLTQCK